MTRVMDPVQSESDFQEGPVTPLSPRAQLKSDSKGISRACSTRDTDDLGARESLFWNSHLFFGHLQ